MLIVEVPNIVVAYTHCFVVLSSEKNSSLCKLYQSKDVRLLFKVVILREVVVWPEILKLDLKVLNLFTNSIQLASIKIDIVWISLANYFIHARVKIP